MPYTEQLRGPQRGPGAPLRRSPAFNDGTPRGYLWRIVQLGAAVALAACAAPDYAQPAAKSWPFFPAVQTSGVIPAQLPMQYVQVLQEPIRQPAQQYWPFGRGAQQATQSFHFQLSEPPKVRLDAETFGQPSTQSWPWNRFSQPFQPLLIFRQSDSLRLEAEAYGQPQQSSWKYGYQQQQAQPFSIWSRPVSVSLEPESFSVPAIRGWTYTTQAQSPQSFHFLLNRIPTARIEQESQQPTAQNVWAFGRTYTVQAWNWWQTQPPEPVPDTAADRAYDYRSRDFWADLRPFLITPTNPVVSADSEYIVRFRRVRNRCGGR